MPAVLDPDTAVTIPTVNTFSSDTTRPRVTWMWAAAIIVAAAGIALRVCHWAAFTGQGFDEVLYAHYLAQLLKVGLGGYPDIVDSYMTYQKTLEGSILPPTRFLYIFCAYLWHGVFGGEPLACFYAVSRLFGVGTLLVSGCFARRLLPDRCMALGVFALMAFSPLQIHMAQHALADGFFEFFVLLTLWALWENLRQPGRPVWLATYAAGLALMVTTKENAFFVFVAVVGLLIANRWLRFGTVNRTLLAMTFVGPLLGVAILTNLAGGLRALLDVYLLGVPKNLHLEYAILTGDGPWYRYLVDLLTVSPLVLLLAAGMVFQLRREDRAAVVRVSVHPGQLRADGQREVRHEPAVRHDMGFRVANPGDGAGDAARVTGREQVATPVLDGDVSRSVYVRPQPILPAGGGISVI